MAREALDPIGAEIVEVEAPDEKSFIAQAKDADAIIGLGLRLSPNILDVLEKCKIIAGSGIGYDYVDVPAATRNGIVVVNVPDVFVEEVADHTMTLLLACWRQVTLQDRLVREGRWAEARPVLSKLPRLRGSILGLVAFGNIPRLVARRARVFGIRVLAYDPFIHEHAMLECEVEPVGELTELLARSDFVSMHVPLSPATNKLLTDKHFKSMKSTAIFINTGRGPTVDEQALIRALQEGEIAFAGLDVFEKEPIEPDNPLLKMDNVILSAHVASASSRMGPESFRRVGREIAQVLQGRRPLSPVNPEVLR
jgi:D-3-phosphoglycerate dehydrogenase